MKTQCKCINWARKGQEFATEHHPHCGQYNPEQDAATIIRALIKGIKIWASDEDGVHPDCWEAYERGVKK